MPAPSSNDGYLGVARVGFLRRAPAQALDILWTQCQLAHVRVVDMTLRNTEYRIGGFK